MYPEVRTVWIGADSILYATAHRPWPLPDGQWAMTQTWNDLLFAHFPMDKERLRALIPQSLALDLYDGQAWVSVTPFWISNLRPPGVPPMPRVSRFPELNVRTYVTYGGKPGVFFFSLDAGNLSAVWGARLFYRLPYWHADMKSQVRDGWIEYRSHRLHGPKANGRSAEFSGRYRPITVARTATPGSLDEFLSERYCLYAVTRKHVYRAEIHHLPWELQIAEVETEIETMREAAGLDESLGPPIHRFSKRLKVLVWGPEKLK